MSLGVRTGVYVYAEGGVGGCKPKAASTAWQNTSITVHNISLKAEGETPLRGLIAPADLLNIKTGGMLTFESLQAVAESMWGSMESRSVSKAFWS